MKILIHSQKHIKINPENISFWEQATQQQEKLRQRQHQASASDESLFFFSFTIYRLLELYTSKITESEEEKEEGEFSPHKHCFSLLFFPFMKAMVNMKAQMYFIYLHSFNRMKATLRSHYLIPIKGAFSIKDSRKMIVILFVYESNLVAMTLMMKMLWIKLLLLNVLKKSNHYQAK